MLPNRLLWRLTFINIIVVGTFIVLSSWAIYNTACFLADGLGSWNEQKQNLFNSTLFQYLWIFSIAAIIIGSLIHYYLVKKTIRPLKELIESTKRMKEGQYPRPIQVNSKDETGQLIGHFNDLVKQLKDTQQHRKELILDLSHDFRTPLSNLKGYLGALKDGVIEADQKMYESLHNESERLIHMVEQLEQLREWDYLTKQTYHEKEPMDMQFLVEESVRMFRWSLLNAGIKVEIQAEIGIVNVYNEGILQVINNLLDNAIRYYEGTGPIRIKGEIIKGRYMLSITGPGQVIPIEAKEKIFERLYRVDSSRGRDNSGGTGLGLAISKEIIEHHKGKISVKSEKNCHTFMFSLPVCK
ncbi:sensor histidine kinase [Pseudalkalibacillus berkeleyi]|uniref:histidine kinase n=1 Tax=Pseudalkalibacillus berkeleyi TaxID=1069813 RepID=A0ABS9H3Q3_9BACL|nr:HAMP domain-containing sensor histidine kinase [Pseudalkalibacillus berkeleyi]MCF6138428.1 ATP-binding protein [Pseudalkalibacillus berkeleyi]